MPKPKPSNINEVDLDISEESDIYFYVESPSGSKVPLLTDDEVLFYEDKASRYQKDYKFTNVSDLLELDRLMLLELTCFRWGTWLLRGEVDYNGNPKMNLDKMIQVYSKEVRDVKAGLGIDKKSRDANRGEDTANFVSNLLHRAKEFGVHRNEQIIKAYTNWKELQGIITLYKNCTESERKIFHCEIEDILNYLEEKFDEFDQIDEAFRKSQKIWIRSELND